MRVWTWRDLPMAGGPQDEGGQLTIGYTVDDAAAFIRCAVFSPFLHGTLLDFIVDACNAAEQRSQHDQSVLGVLKDSDGLVSRARDVIERMPHNVDSE